jgi:hypothetical protein
MRRGYAATRLRRVAGEAVQATRWQQTGTETGRQDYKNRTEEEATAEVDLQPGRASGKGEETLDRSRTGSHSLSTD